MSETETFKIKDIGRGGAFARYRTICYGDRSWGYVVLAEVMILLIGGLPGALGLALRKALYPRLFKQCGRGVVFGRNITLRHPHKVVLGDGVVLDDQCVIDAKGESNKGIVLGNGVYVGRNTIIYCKNGDIEIGDRVNISSNCQLFSSHRLVIEQDTVIAAFVYVLSGGQYDYRDPTPFAAQSGMITRGPTTIGPNNWLGAGVVVVDGVTTGAHCVVGAGAVVAGDVPADSLALGVPAKSRPLPGPSTAAE